jgi:hypothetical protein
MSASETRAKEISDALRAPFDPSLIEQKQNKDYIAAEHIRHRIITATGNQFSWTHNFWEVRENDGTMPANQKTGEIPRVMVFGGTLSIPGLGERFGIGVQEMQGNSGADAAYKGAESDAFKRAAMAFGVGLDQLYIKSAPVAPQRATRPSPPRPATNGSASAAVAMSDAVFANQVREAAQAKDGAAYRQLSSIAGKSVVRWRALITSADTEPALDWMLRQMERQGITDKDLLLEVDAHRGLIKEGALASV